MTTFMEHVILNLFNTTSIVIANGRLCEMYDIHNGIASKQSKTFHVFIESDIYKHPEFDNLKMLVKSAEPAEFTDEIACLAQTLVFEDEQFKYFFHIVDEMEDVSNLSFVDVYKFLDEYNTPVTSIRSIGNDVDEKISTFLKTVRGRAVISGGWATAEALRILGIDFSFTPNDIDIFFAPSRAKDLDAIPFKNGEYSYTDHYDIAMGIGKNSFFARSRIDVVDDGKKYQFIMLDECDGCVAKLADTTRKYMDFKALSQTYASNYGGTLWFSIANNDDLYKKVLNLNESDEGWIMTKQSRIDKWTGRGFSKGKIPTDHIKKIVTRDPTNNVVVTNTDNTTFVGLRDCTVVVRSLHYHLIDCTGIILVLNEHDPKGWIESSEVTVVSGKGVIKSVISQIADKSEQPEGTIEVIMKDDCRDFWYKQNRENSVLIGFD